MEKGGWGKERAELTNSSPVPPMDRASGGIQENGVHSLRSSMAKWTYLGYS